MTDCFVDEGYQANYEGFERCDCPYGEGTDGQCGWLIGWEKYQNQEGV